MHQEEINKQINLSRKYTFDTINKCQKKGILPQFCALGCFIEIIEMSLCLCQDEKYIRDCIEEAWEIAKDLHAKKHKQ